MIAIVGGGISGLALGWELNRLGIPFHIFEASDAPGGVMRSAEVGGQILDWGPQRVRLTKQLRDLIQETGLQDEMIAASGDASLFTYHGGRLRKIPFDPWDFLATDALTLKGKLRLLLEPFTGPAKDEESVATFFRRKLGQEVYDHIAGPLYGGLYSSDPEDMVMGLSLGHVLEHFGVRRSLFLRLLICVFQINFKKSIKFDDLTRGNQFLICIRNLDRDRSFLQSCIRHLRGNGTLPDQFIKSLFIAITCHLKIGKISRPNGFVCFLGTFRFGGKLS